MIGAPPPEAETGGVGVAAVAETATPKINTGETVPEAPMIGITAGIAHTKSNINIGTHPSIQKPL